MYVGKVQIPLTNCAVVFSSLVEYSLARVRVDMISKTADEQFRRVSQVSQFLRKNSTF